MLSRLLHSWAALICVLGGELCRYSKVGENLIFLRRWDTSQHIIIDDAEVGPGISEIWPGILNIDPAGKIIVDGR
jgi:hypothetical protein